MRRVRERLAALRDQAGYSLTELITAMGILGVVMASLTGAMVSATNAEVHMNNDFQAQTQARMALERFRREAHSACGAAPAGPSATVTLHYVTAGACPTTGGTQVTWCTVLVSAGRYRLFRMSGETCSASGKQIADYLTVASAFDYHVPLNRRAKVGLTLTVDRDPAKVGGTYRLDDDIVLRNSPRPA